ncbi:MAG: hypothetical protein RIR70_1197 [Pseudomonadota bacterium]|jgi:L-threonylcarbamoyladenylate synthase
MTAADDITRAVALLRAGELVAFPTETVYGLGADAQNPHAVAKIFAAKGRPADHPLIVHLPEAEQITQWARTIPREAIALARAFWPGPLTLILKRSEIVPDAVTGGQDTVGLRVPAHPLALQLLAAFGSGLAAPSANRFGKVSPTTAQHVRDELGDRVPLILDGGPCQVGIESTIIDLSEGTPVLLRPGMISPGEIASVIGREVRARAPAQAGTRVSGMLEAHYAPTTPLRLLDGSAFAAALQSALDAGRRVGVVSHVACPPALVQTVRWLCLSSEPRAYAHDIYASLRMLDEAGLDCIFVESPPPDAQWAPIRDRLLKSAAGSGGASV